MVFVAACGGSDDSDRSTSTPLPPPPTPTPFSTPLPVGSTPVLVGTEMRPLVMGFLVPIVDSTITAAENDLADEINDRVFSERYDNMNQDLVVEVESLSVSKEALTLVCDGDAALAWVDAFTFIAAEQACGAQPLLLVRKDRAVEVDGLPDDVTVNARTGVSFDIVYNSVQTIPSVNEIVGKTVCRLGPDDPFSWVYLTLTLRGAGISPITDLPEIFEVEDYVGLVRAVINDECDLGAIPRGSLEDLLGELADDEDLPVDLSTEPAPVELITPTWPEVPHEILIAPPDSVLLPDVRDAVVSALEELIDDSDALEILLDYESIQPVNSVDLIDFRQWLAAAGWEMGS